MGACIVDGVAWDVLGDFGSTPFVLDRDSLDYIGADLDRPAELTPLDAAFESIGELVLGASWAWGATSPLGPLTEPAAGRATLSLLDTTRLFDPLNVDSPFGSYLTPGLPVAITADGAPAFTGSLASWSHDLGPSESTLELVDAVAEAAAAPANAVAVAAGSSMAQAAAVVGAAGWSARVDLIGSGSFDRDPVAIAAGPLLEQLAGIRRAELAEVYATRAGRLAMRGSAEPYAPATSATINCGGIALTALESAIAFDRVRNVVRIRDHVPETYESSSSRRRIGAREVSTSVADLAFDV